MLDKMAIDRAVKSSSRQDYVRSVNALTPPALKFDEADSIILFRELRDTGVLPVGTHLTLSDLQSGLAVVEGEQNVLKDVEQRCLDVIESAGLSFLTDHSLQVEPNSGGLVRITKTGSVAVATYYLVTTMPYRREETHLLNPLPAWSAHDQRSVVTLDLPPTYTMSLHASRTNHSQQQETCGSALASQNYEAVFQEPHVACEFRDGTFPLATELVRLVTNLRFVLINGDPAAQAQTKVFLRCAGRPNYSWILDKQYNLFKLPASCSLDVARATKLISFPRYHAAPGEEFEFLLAWNLSFLPRPWSKTEQLWISLGSIVGAGTILALVALYVAVNFHRQLRGMFLVQPTPPSDEGLPIGYYRSFKNFSVTPSSGRSSPATPLAPAATHPGRHAQTDLVIDVADVHSTSGSGFVRPADVRANRLTGSLSSYATIKRVPHTSGAMADAETTL